MIVHSQFTKGDNVDKEMFEKGLGIRRQVLGAEFVDNAFATADDFNRPLQELVTHLGAERRLVVARELTKRFEEVTRGTTATLSKRPSRCMRAAAASTKPVRRLPSAGWAFSRSIWKPARLFTRPR